jgi:hypothetical protein
MDADARYTSGIGSSRSAGERLRDPTRAGGSGNEFEAIDLERTTG